MTAIYYARATVDLVADALGISEEARTELPDQDLHFVSLDAGSFLAVDRRPTPEDYEDLQALFEPPGPGITPMAGGSGSGSGRRARSR